MKMQKKSEHKQIQIIGITALVLFVVGVVLATAGLSNTIGQIDDTVISRTPSAILASAGVNEKEDITLPVVYYDQRSDKCVNLYDASQKSAARKRQFEWGECGYYRKALEQGLVEYNLNDKFLPVATGKAELMANMGLGTLERWFSNVEGKSKNYVGNISMKYDAKNTAFSFEADEFYPLEDATFSDGDIVNRDGRNHLFTMNFAVPFAVLENNEESFEITADDDTFVFVGDALALDMGGVHDAITGRILVNKDGEVQAAVGDEELAFTGIALENKSDAIVRIFHADRDSNNSVLKLNFRNVSINMVRTQLAEGDGVQVAYDPADPSYVAPLGESAATRPDVTRGRIVMATVFGVVVVVFSVLAAMLARQIMRNRQ